MATTSDHVKRDAEHAARNEISTFIGKFTRRMNESAKAAIATRINAIEAGTTIDFDFGTQVGKEAALAAIQEFLYDNPTQVAARPSLEA